MRVQAERAAHRPMAAPLLGLSTASTVRSAVAAGAGAGAGPALLSTLAVAQPAAPGRLAGGSAPGGPARDLLRIVGRP